MVIVPDVCDVHSIELEHGSELLGTSGVVESDFCDFGKEQFVLEGGGQHVVGDLSEPGQLVGHQQSCLHLLSIDD